MFKFIFTAAGIGGFVLAGFVGVMAFKNYRATSQSAAAATTITTSQPATVDAILAVIRAFGDLRIIPGGATDAAALRSQLTDAATDNATVLNDILPFTSPTNNPNIHPQLVLDIAALAATAQLNFSVDQRALALLGTDDSSPTLDMALASVADAQTSWRGALLPVLNTIRVAIIDDTPVESAPPTGAIRYRITDQERRALAAAVTQALAQKPATAPYLTILNIDLTSKTYEDRAAALLKVLPPPQTNTANKQPVPTSASTPQL